MVYPHDYLGAERRDAPDSDPWDWLTGLAGPPSIAGSDISPLTALGVPTVRAAVELIAGSTGILSVSFYREAEKGGNEVAGDHPGQALVADAANRWTSTGELRQQLM